MGAVMGEDRCSQGQNTDGTVHTHAAPLEASELGLE